jgi:hypothetical protein
MRPHLAWFVVLPLSLVGSACGHAAVNGLMGSPTGSSGELFAGGGPGADIALLLLAVAAASLVLALGGRLVGAVGSPHRRISALPFACLAPLAFVAQEHLEMFLHTGGVPFRTVLEPSFLPGLALQLPFALAAYLIALALWRAADSLRRQIGRTSVVVPRLTPASRVHWHLVGGPLTSLHVGPHPGRGPPGRRLRSVPTLP